MSTCPNAQGYEEKVRKNFGITCLLLGVLVILVMTMKGCG